MTLELGFIPDSKPVADPPQVVEEEQSKRRVRITREHLNSYSLTDRCQGCTAIRRGIAKQPRSEACRTRIETKLREAGDKDLES